MLSAVPEEPDDEQRGTFANAERPRIISKAPTLDAIDEEDDCDIESRLSEHNKKRPLPSNVR